MNQRARLIPSIAKCMAYWIKPGKNRSLQERLAYTREQNRTENRPLISTYNDDTKAYLKESLWRIAQKQLYNTPTPKQLNHERFFLRMEVDRQNKDEDMLLEESLEGTEDLCDAYDDYTNCGLGADPHLIAGDKPFELEVCDAGSCGSSMIFGNSQTEQPMEMLDDYSDARIDQGVAETWATVFAPRLSRSFLSGGFEIGDVDRLDGDVIMQGYAREELLSQAPRWRTWTEILDEENSDCEMLLNETMEEHL
ncbi:hypothetical protein ASPCAL03800 [Aspergillus calidoustus]|uniref:Uncharacterized protein n=1 Tax=Aspergillus calidoustus TaxID=454130 RepID=A0A0U5C456_ASPCI|nr:hypothetical protein ASPCAL03800 [Aspergillus calidoustus]